MIAASNIAAAAKAIGWALGARLITFADLDPDGAWLAAARLELPMLQDRFAFSPDTKMNAAFIIGSPEQQFVSVADLGDGEPDFHQPDKFRAVEFVHEDKLKELMGH